MNWSNTVEVKMTCGICDTSVTTRVATSTERDRLLKDFHDAHKTCRISSAARAASA